MSEYVITEADQKQWAEAMKPIEEYNEKTKVSNDRLLKVLKRMYGAAWVKNLKKLLADCEVGTYMMDARYGITHSRCGQYQQEKYGKIRGYWVEQWPVGDSGDSWEGYIYVELKPGRYLKAAYSM